MVSMSAVVWAVGLIRNRLTELDGSLDQIRGFLSPAEGLDANTERPYTEMDWYNRGGSEF
jgi:hypothetical protein